MFWEKKESYDASISARAPKNLKALIMQIAAAEGVSLNEMVVRLLKNGVVYYHWTTRNKPALDSYRKSEDIESGLQLFERILAFWADDPKHKRR